MSASSELMGSGKLAGRTSFNQTCSLLSHYLKEKGNFGDLRLGMTCPLEPNAAPSRPAATTMDLFPVTEKQGQVSSQNPVAMDLFPQEDELSKISDSSSSNKSKTGSKEPEAAAQMTIFYGGQVIVFNDFPADKAKEVMLMASKATSALAPTRPQSPFATPNLSQNPVTPSPPIPQSPVEPIACDLPIARRASLHRFLEKRKDRLTAKTPYLMASSLAPPKTVENKPWLGLAAQSAQ